MVYAAILAGGSGTRMEDSGIPKQFMKLGETPIIMITIENILAVKEIDKLYIAVIPEWLDTLSNWIQKLGIQKEKIRLLKGGETRLKSIEYLLDRLVQDEGNKNEDLILIHDAVRPFISSKIIKDSIKALGKYDAVGVAYPVVDTMFWIEENQMIRDMPDREHIFCGQTPDSFKVNTLIKAMKELTDEEKSKITGTAQICLLKGIPIYTVKGSGENFKITTKWDYKMAKVLYENKKEYL